MAMAARMPMIATTIISSMRVKPRWLRMFRWRLFQKRSIRSSLNVRSSLPRYSCPKLPPCGGAPLNVGRDWVRRSATLREPDGDESYGARFERNIRGVTGIADRRRGGFSGVGEEVEQGEILSVVGSVVGRDRDV